MRLHIRHETAYLYDRPIAFGVQRLLMRPTDSHAMRVINASISFTPPGATRWSHDALGNSICLFQPEGFSDTLRVVSELVIERFPAPLPSAEVYDPRHAMPITYSLEDRLLLDPFIRPATSDESGAHATWLTGHTGVQGLALPFLQALNSAIHQTFQYGERQEEGTQSPTETIQRGAGTCRDFAWLMVESARRMGFAARFVTGYLYAPSAQSRGGGATHAWCEVYLPGLGWLEFDPTNGLAESGDLIRIASARTPEEASPMSGAILGVATGRLEVSVTVEPAATNVFNFAR
jgi:transglutaminase-like putative cysteine protease